MRKAVLDNWVKFNKPMEGYLNFPYLDQLGLVTVGLGNLIDPLGSVALNLPWLLEGVGRLATYAEITSGWRRVKSRQDLRMNGGGAFAGVGGIYLPKSAIDALVRQKLLENVGKLKETFQKFEEWPADAQMGALSIAWAAGAGIFTKALPDGFPKLTAALRDSPPDFVTASHECSLRGNAPRSLVQARCFRNAAKVQAEGLDPEVLL